MTELTLEQIEATKTMTLDQIRDLALKEAEASEISTFNGSSTSTNVPAEPVTQARDDKGRFVPADAQGNPADADAEEVEEDGEPTSTIYRKEIANGDGSIDVYEADSLEGLVEKLAVGKLNANKKIQEFISEKKAAAVKTSQVTADDEYIVAEKLKKNPKQTMKEVVTEVIEERLAKANRSNAAQNHFVASHPDFIPTPENANRLTAWLQTHGHTEITIEGLEKGYQDLKASGLLKLKAEGADGNAEVPVVAIDQTGQPAVGTTQTRSSKKGSTVSTRSGSRTAVPTNTQPSEDEAYKMPMEQLLELANRQLSAARS